MKTKIAIALSAIALFGAGFSTQAVATDERATIINSEPGSYEVYIDGATGSAFVNTLSGWKRTTTTTELKNSKAGSYEVYVDPNTGSTFVHTDKGWQRASQVSSAPKGA